MPTDELSITLASATLSSGVSLSGNSAHITTEDASIVSTALVLLHSSADVLLDNATLSSSTKVYASATLSAVLGNAVTERFSASLDGISAPYEDVLSWTGHPLTGSRVRVRTGNLYGIFGEPGEFGIFAGDGWDADSGAPPDVSSQYIRLGNYTNEFHNVPVRLYDNGNVTIQLEPDAPSFAMGSPIPSGYDTGIGLWQGRDVDGIYKWRIGDPSGASLNWDGTGLSINNGSLDIGGVDAHLAFGNPPPTSPTSGTGIWVDRTGLYGVNAGVTQIFIDTIDGILYVDGGTEFGVNPLLGDLYVDGVLTLGTDGRMQQGTGTWGVDFTGSAIWNSSGVMNIGGWNDNVKQWWGGSDGMLYAGGGDVILNENGIAIHSVIGNEFVNPDSLKFQDIGNTEFIMAKMWAFKGYGTVQTNHLLLETETDNATYGTSITLSAHKTVGGSADDATVTVASKASSTPSWIRLLANDILLNGNVEVNGTLKDGDGVAYLKSTGKAADSDKLDGLDSTDFGRPVFLSAPLTNSAWLISSEGRSTTGSTKIDLSDDFGVPDGIKAVLVRLVARDSGTFPQTETYIAFGPTATYWYTFTAYVLGNDVQASINGIIPCGGGDIYYRVKASGTNTMDVQLEIWGYWL